MSPEQYLEIERAAEFRSENIAGEMFAMSGGSLAHARIAANALRRVMEQLDGKPCDAVGGDMRVFCARRNVFTYPDVVVICGSPKFLDDRRDVITDATAIMEVLSPSTRNYDRGEKFRYYRSLESLSDYFLIEQAEVRAEHYVRQPDGSWLFREITDPAAEVPLRSIGGRLRLDSLYDRVDLEA